MTFNQQKQYDQYLAQRVVDDLDERSLNGSYIYFMAWVLVGGGTGFHKAEPFFFWTVSIILLASGLFRLNVISISRNLQTRTSDSGPFCNI